MKTINDFIEKDICVPHYRGNWGMTTTKTFSVGLKAERRKMAIKGALKYASWGHRFPFTAYPDTEIAFWPGCSLAGATPRIVQEIASLLEEYLHQKVGVILDCCFDPLHQLGESDSVERAAKEIREKIKKRGIHHVILGCLNCLKIFNTYLAEIRTDHVLNIISERHFRCESLHGDIFLHHPCQAFRFEGLRERTRGILLSKNIIFSDSPVPQCCGLGGGENIISPERADARTDSIVCSSEGKKIVAYCMGCKNRLLAHGTPAIHLLECLSRKKPLERPVRPVLHWANRLMLAMRTNHEVTDPIAWG